MGKYGILGAHMLQSKSRYYYTRLDKTGQYIYNRILSAWESRSRDASFPSNPLSTRVYLQKIVEYISYDNPGLFYIDFSRTLITSTAFKTIAHVNFHFGDRQISDAENQLQKVVSTLLSKYPFDKMDKYDKEIVLHDYLAETVSYADEGINDGSISIIGGLLTHRAVCEGYAKSFKLLCDAVGLSSIMVTGRGKPKDGPEENHAWNIVKLDGVCAHVDVTWDSTTRIGREASHDHFNLTDDDIGHDHFWDRSTFPPCVSDQNNYFVKSGGIVADNSDLKKYASDQFAMGKRALYVKFSRKIVDQVQISQMVNAILVGDRRLSGLKYSSISVSCNPVRGTASIFLM